MNARTHSTCFGSLRGVSVSGQRRIVSLYPLVFEIFDHSITVELRLFLDILYERPRFGLLSKV